MSRVARIAMIAAALGATACGGGPKTTSTVPSRAGGQPQDLNGDTVPDVWIFTQKDGGRSVMRRAEFDINFDGKVDVWRFYDLQGRVERDRMDLDFDGKVDVTGFYARGVLTRKELDLAADEKPDVFKYYEDGVLTRLEGDSDSDGRVDYWEYYKAGRLVRAGSDADGDGRPDPDAWIETAAPQAPGVDDPEN